MQFTRDNVIDRFRYSAGAPVGKGTLNLNFAVPLAMQPTKVAIGRQPVNPATYVLGAGATLHIPPGRDGAVPTSSVTFNNVDPAALNRYIKVGSPAGPWIPGVNDCNTWASQTIYNSTPHNLTYSMYEVPITYATGVVVYADGSIH